MAAAEKGFVLKLIVGVSLPLARESPISAMQADRAYFCSVGEGNFTDGG